MAWNCSVVPSGIVEADGVTAKETIAGAPTVNGVEAVAVPCVAVMVAVPVPALVANPLALTTTTVADEELHSAVPVKSCVLPSLYVPVALNCCPVPNGIVALCGLTAIDISAAGFTVTLAVPLIAPIAIAIVLVPVPTVLASPCVPGVLLIVTAPAFVELQCPACVTSNVLPSLYVPSAVNGCVVPSGVTTTGGFTAIDTSAAAVTVNVPVPVTVPILALIVAVPCPALLASPA